jgi:hypothetical protein
LDYLTTHTSLSPIRREFAPGFVNYKKGALDSQPQVCIFENNIDEEKKTLQKRYIESFQSDLSIDSVIENSWASVD